MIGTSENINKKDHAGLVYTITLLNQDDDVEYL